MRKQLFSLLSALSVVGLIYLASCAPEVIDEIDVTETTDGSQTEVFRDAAAETQARADSLRAVSETLINELQAELDRQADSVDNAEAIALLEEQIANLAVDIAEQETLLAIEQAIRQTDIDEATAEALDDLRNLLKDQQLDSLDDAVDLAVRNAVQDDSIALSIQERIASIQALRDASDADIAAFEIVKAAAAIEQVALNVNVFDKSDEGNVDNARIGTISGATVTASQNGAAVALDSLQPGTATISVEAAGYLTFTFDIDLPEASADVEFDLAGGGTLGPIDAYPVTVDADVELIPLGENVTVTGTVRGIIQDTVDAPTGGVEGVFGLENTPDIADQLTGNTDIFDIIQDSFTSADTTDFFTNPSNEDSTAVDAAIRNVDTYYALQQARDQLLLGSTFNEPIEGVALTLTTEFDGDIDDLVTSLEAEDSDDTNLNGDVSVENGDLPGLFAGTVTTDSSGVYTVAIPAYTEDILHDLESVTYTGQYIEIAMGYNDFTDSDLDFVLDPSASEEVAEYGGENIAPNTYNTAEVEFGQFVDRFVETFEVSGGGIKEPNLGSISPNEVSTVTEGQEAGNWLLPGGTAVLDDEDVLENEPDFVNPTGDFVPSEARAASGGATVTVDVVIKR